MSQKGHRWAGKDACKWEGPWDAKELMPGVHPPHAGTKQGMAHSA